MGDGAGGVAFAGEAPLESRVYWWHDRVQSPQAQVLQPGPHGAVEQVQPDPLRPRQPAAEDGAEQHLLPRSHRQVHGSDVHHHAGREHAAGGASSASAPGSPCEDLCVQDRQQGVGVRVEVSVSFDIFTTSISSARGTGVSGSGGNGYHDTHKYHKPNTVQLWAKDSLRRLWGDSPRGTAIAVSKFNITRRTTPLHYLPEAASLSSSRAHSEPLVLRLGAEAEHQDGPDGSVPGRLPVLPLARLAGGRRGLVDLPLTWPSPCTPSAKYPPGGPAPMRRCC